MIPPCYYSRYAHTDTSSGGNLPHWSQACATFVTFRLADSLPADKLAQFKSERDVWLAQHPEPWNEPTSAEYRELFSRRFHAWLDAGYGSCFLAEPELRKIVEETLTHFADVRYSLYAYVVMPNHVHVLFMPAEGVDGRGLVAEWKRYTSRVINAKRGTKGALWQKESYDHLVRDVREFNAIRAYIRGNAPELAFDVYVEK